MQFHHQSAAPVGVTLAVPVFTGLTQSTGSQVDLDATYLASRGFTGKLGQTHALLADDGGTVLAVGMGDEADLDGNALRKAAAAMVRASWKEPALAFSWSTGAVKPADAVQAIVEGALLASYRFGAYRTEDRSCRIGDLTLVGGAARAATTGIERGTRIATAVALARDLVNEPPGGLTPRRLAEVATDVGEEAGLSVTVWDENDIAREKLGALAGVAAGSAEPARLIRLAYDPPGRPRATVALIGKGITFDSGGLSLKTADGMVQMKTDMGGAAAVLAAMTVLPSLNLPIRVLGFLPTTENMPGGRATKPGDVLRARNGTTIEVLNTDAEGRLVLADGICLALEEGVDAIVDLATLTGAVSIALGKEIAAVLGNDQGLVDQVRGAADRSGEKVWQLPLPPEYRCHLDSEIADIKNTGRPGQAGTIAGALFLERFVGDTPWAHLDIAGTARSEEDSGFLSKGGTGYGVRLLVELLSGFKKPTRASS
ncbi:MAG TPA: leucyl aminopeptidase [Acidimicrobiales bacterium]|nr:leucyl aminopeptidase [Acidimicrobiales bacterium]